MSKPHRDFRFHFLATIAFLFHVFGELWRFYKEYRHYWLILQEIEQKMDENLTVSQIVEALEKGETLSREQVRPLELLIAIGIGYVWVSSVQEAPTDIVYAYLLPPATANNWIGQLRYRPGRLGRPLLEGMIGDRRGSWALPNFTTNEQDWAIVEQWMVERDWWIAYAYLPGNRLWEATIQPPGGRIHTTSHPQKLAAVCLAFAKASGIV